MKLKKIIASLTAAAMAVTTMAFAPLSVSAVNAVDFGSSDGQWAQADFVNQSSSEMTGVDLTSVTSVTFNAVAYDLNYGWNNGQFYVDGNNWAQKSFGGSNSSVDVTLDAAQTFSMSLDFGVKVDDNNNWALGWGTGTGKGAFAILSIDFYEGSSKIGTWADNEWYETSESVFVPVDFGSADGQWAQSDFVNQSSAEMAGADLTAVTSVKINALVYDLNYGWNNGQFYVDGNNWAQKSFGGSNSSVDVTLDSAQALSVTLDFGVKTDDNNNWSIGWGTGTGKGAFAVYSIEFFAGSENVGIWTNNVWLPETVAVKSVNVTPSTAALVVGDTTTLKAEVLPADATDPTITWTSSDDKVASVDENGKVTAVAEGKATITATSNADSAIFGSCEVTVVSPEAEKYALNITKPENGTVAIKGDITEAFANETIELVITPDADYALDTVTVNGKTISGTSFTMPAEDVTITVTFKKIGSADAEVVAPEGVSVSFAGSKEDILKAVFGDDYAALVEAGYKLDVVMTVKDETAVSAEDKALVEGALSGDMHVALLVDVSLVMTKDGVSTVVANSSKPVSFVIGVPDSVIADGRTYSVIRVHDGAAEDIGGTYDAANKTITVSSDKYSTYAVVYKDAPAPKPQPTVTYYPITADRNVTASASSAAAGEQINVRVDFGYDAYVYCGGRVISKITENGSFTMPAGKVTIVSQANGYLVMIKNAAPNSYIFVYDADMNYIKTNGSVKGIKGEGKITVKLGEEYAGKTVTLYKGRKSTNVELDSKTLDENGNATFTVEGGKNYTAVVE